MTLFHFFGFPVKADGSWLFLSVLIVWSLTNKVFPAHWPGHAVQTYQLMGFAAMLLIFVSIVAHEVAHAVIAEHYQMPIDSITLFIFGGVAEMRGEPSHPKGEFLMAIAGPLMSAFTGLFFWAMGALALHAGPALVTPNVLIYVGWLNLVIAAFNIVPAFPLDGGRALRAVIWQVKDNLVLATRIASSLGAGFAYMLLGYALYRIVWWNDMLSGMWFLLLGYFVHAAGAYAVRQTETRSLLGGEKVSRFVNAQVVSVSPDITIADLVDKYVYQHYQRSFPVVDKGALVGVITLQGILSLDRHKWHWLHVASVMEDTDASNCVDPDSSAADALNMMQRQRRDSLIVARGTALAGIVSYRDLAAYLSITMKIDHNRPVVTSRTA